MPDALFPVEELIRFFRLPKVRADTMRQRGRYYDKTLRYAFGADATGTSAGNLPDATQVDSWIRINPDNTANLLTSQIEVGNDITTGFLQVLAEELDMDMSQMVRHVRAREDRSFDLDSRHERGAEHRG